MPEISFQLLHFTHIETEAQGDIVACLMAQQADDVLSNCLLVSMYQSFLQMFGAILRTGEKHCDNACTNDPHLERFAQIDLKGKLSEG